MSVDLRLSSVETMTTRTASAGKFPQRIAGRIPSLDGLRAVAILLVVWSHGKYSLGDGLHGAALGRLGVRIFFVISGFLITGLLLQEREKTGAISLRDFYLRRAFRILPASYMFLLCMAAAAALGMIVLPFSVFISAWFYFQNYYTGPGVWDTGHLWSLCVEEQFYLLWPAILTWFGPRKAVWCALISLPIATVCRFSSPLSATFEANMDALACGCILSCVWGYLGSNRRWQSFLRSPFFWCVPIAIIGADKLEAGSVRVWATSMTFVHILIAVAIERCVRYPTGFAMSILNSRPAVAIGTLSYSLYLWQQPWLSENEQGWGRHFPQNFIMAALCAILSYFIIERPFLRLRDSFRKRPARSVSSNVPAVPSDCA